MRFNFADYLIETNMDICVVEDLTIHESLNKHASLHMAGLFVPDISDEELIQEHTISVYTKEDMLVFHGSTTETDTRRIEHGTIRFCVEAQALTQKLDIEPKSRTFQNLDMTYKDILDQVTADYPEAKYIATADIGRKIPHLIVQYKETDWQFILRLASHFTDVVVTEAKSFSPAFYFGQKKVPEARNLLEAKHTFERSKCFEIVKRPQQTKLQENMGYILESYEQYGVCQSLSFDGIKYIITDMHFFMDKALSTYQYVLEREDTIGLCYIKNSNIKGAKLHGVVQEIERDKMRIHFEIDSHYEGANNIFISYAGGVNNEQGFYMPIPGSVVEIAFPNDDEKDCFVLATVRINADFDMRLDNHQEKHFRNNFHREFSLFPKHVQFITGNDGIRVQLGDDGNVAIRARDIHINAGNHFQAGAVADMPEPKRIQISADNQVVLSDKSGINSIFMTPNCEIVCNAITKVETAGEPCGDRQVTSSAGTVGAPRRKASEKASHLFQEHQKHQRTVEELRGASLALAASSFTSSALGSDGENTSILSLYMQRKVLEMIQDVPISKVSSGEHNPICDYLLGGNIQLFNAISYGKCVIQ